MATAMFAFRFCIVIAWRKWFGLLWKGSRSRGKAQTLAASHGYSHSAGVAWVLNGIFKSLEFGGLFQVRIFWIA